MLPLKLCLSKNRELRLSALVTAKGIYTPKIALGLLQQYY
jgi:hypothetical protein